MKARTRAILSVMAVALLLVAAALLVPRRPSGLQDLSGQDIAQIRKRVRVEILRRALGAWSLAQMRHFPRQIRHALTTHIDPPDRWDNVSGHYTMINGQSTNFADNSWVVLTSNGEGFVVVKHGQEWWINGRN
jgi:hypothetical protein